MGRLGRPVRYYGVAAIGGAVAAFAGVEAWRGLAYLQHGTYAAAGLYFAAYVAYVFFGGYYLWRQVDRVHVVASLAHLALVTISVYGSLDAIGDILVSAPRMFELFQWFGTRGRAVLGILDQGMLALTCLVVSAFLASYLILHPSRRH